MAKNNHSKKNETPENTDAAADTEIIDDAEAAEDNPDPVKALEDSLKAEQDKYLRLAAEYDNYRRRNQKERENLYTDVRSDTITKLLPVYDNLERALGQQTEDAAFFKGVEMTMAQLKEILESIGVSEIPTVGQTFDPSLHNAVLHIDDENYGDNEIVEEFQKGFKLGDKVIRFSMVKVAN